jgi:hypothetical protein
MGDAEGLRAIEGTRPAALRDVIDSFSEAQVSAINLTFS